MMRGLSERPLCLQGADAGQGSGKEGLLPANSLSCLLFDEPLDVCYASQEE